MRPSSPHSGKHNLSIFKIWLLFSYHTSCSLSIRSNICICVCRRPITHAHRYSCICVRSCYVNKWRTSSNQCHNALLLNFSNLPQQRPNKFVILSDRPTTRHPAGTRITAQSKGTADKIRHHESFRRSSSSTCTERHAATSIL